MKKTVTAAGLAAVALAVLTGTVLAASFSLFGDAQIVSPGNASLHAVRIRSDATIPPSYGGISFPIPAGTTFGQLDVLSSDFKPELDDLCIGGSPRFSIGIDTDGDGDRDASIFAYLGPDSGSAPCAAGVWQNTGDLLDSGKLVDTSQLDPLDPGAPLPGTFYDPYVAALAKYGTLGVTSISLVVDSSWAHPDSEQTFFIDNTNVDGTVYTYDQPGTKDECKDGDWMMLSRPDGTSFKNQGDCVSYTNNGR